MYSFGDVNRLPDYGRDECAWAHHQTEVIGRSRFGGCLDSAAQTLRRWLDSGSKS